MPNQKAEETEEGRNGDGKMELTMTLKLWRKGTGET
jgi:hypothetical protein